jgi:hypothetical protein
MQTLQSIPGMRWMIRHPRLTAWIVLAVGMLLFLFIEARDIGLTATNWIALIVATVLVAGLCVWIVSWEDNNEADAPITPETPAEPVIPPLIDPASETEVTAPNLADNSEMPS